MLSFVILALLGAPVALHVVLHDLHDHEGQRSHAYLNGADHGNHEHPIIPSAVPEAPAPASAVLLMVVVRDPATWIRATRAERNEIAHGAVRLDDDVGLQTLLSTFLI